MYLQTVLLTLAFCSFGTLSSPVQNSKNLGIINGQVAKDKQFPYLVAIYFDRDQANYFCGGSLISNQWVLTAGSCTSGSDVFTLHLGSNTLVDKDSNRITLATAVSITHEDFDFKTLKNNIGLIKLPKSVTFNDWIQPIGLNTEDIAASISATVSGWGQSGNWSGETNDLNYVSVTTINNSDCSASYANVFDETLCTTEGICTSDIGDPLVITGKQHTQIGIASDIGSKGCGFGDLSKFTRISKYREWIRHNTGV